MRIRLAIVAFLFMAVQAGIASAGSICPAGNGTNPFPHSPDAAATGCNAVITINSNGTITVVVTDSTPYDNSEDSLIGVVNNSGGAVASINLSGLDIFGFDGDGICTFTFVGNGYCTPSQTLGTDPLDYAGPTTTFPGWSATSPNSGTVAFTGGLAAGATTYFSLEGIPTASITGTVSGPIAPVPTLSNVALMLLALALAGFAFVRLRG